MTEEGGEGVENREEKERAKLDQQSFSMSLWAITSPLFCLPLQYFPPFSTSVLSALFSFSISSFPFLFQPHFHSHAFLSAALLYAFRSVLCTLSFSPLSTHSISLIHLLQLILPSYCEFSLFLKIILHTVCNVMSSNRVTLSADQMSFEKVGISLSHSVIGWLLECCRMYLSDYFFNHHLSIWGIF